MIRLIASNPLNPSIKLAPFITNKKHNNTNIDEKILLDINGIRKWNINIKYFYWQRINKNKKKENHYN